MMPVAPLKAWFAQCCKKSILKSNLQLCVKSILKSWRALRKVSPSWGPKSRFIFSGEGAAGEVRCRLHPVFFALPPNSALPAPHSGVWISTSPAPAGSGHLEVVWCGLCAPRRGGRVLSVVVVVVVVVLRQNKYREPETGHTDRRFFPVLSSPFLSCRIEFVRSRVFRDGGAFPEEGPQGSTGHHKADVI